MTRCWMTEGLKGCRIHSRPSLKNCTVRLSSRPSWKPIRWPGEAMIRVTLATLLTLLLAMSSLGQEPTTTIQKSSELVTIPVLITDKSGKAVHGLTKQDFTVIEDGKTTRTLAIFDELKSASGPIAAPATKDPGFSNFASSDGQPRRVTI